jgi:hypothetical protein
MRTLVAGAGTVLRLMDALRAVARQVGPMQPRSPRRA